MTLQDLSYFSRLQVPKIDLVILRAAHDPNTILGGVGKASTEGIEVVLVTLIGFDAFGVVIVP